LRGISDTRLENAVRLLPDEFPDKVPTLGQFKKLAAPNTIPYWMQDAGLT
jgi:hypothetical protein